MLFSVLTRTWAYWVLSGVGLCLPMHKGFQVAEDLFYVTCRVLQGSSNGV